MILDNKNTNLKVHEWIAKYTKEGKFNLVTEFFTIGTLAYLSDKINEKIKIFNFVLGDIVHTENVNVRTIDLLNDNIWGKRRRDKGAQISRGYARGRPGCL